MVYCYYCVIRYFVITKMNPNMSGNNSKPGNFQNSMEGQDKKATLNSSSLHFESKDSLKTKLPSIVPTNGNGYDMPSSGETTFQKPTGYPYVGVEGQRYRNMVKLGKLKVQI